MKRAACIIAAVLALSTSAAAHTANNNGKWDHYHSRLSGNVVVIKSRCVMGEDSMAHPKLLNYENHGARIVLGCERHGY